MAAGEVCVELRNLWKVFGPRAEHLLESELRNASKEKILEATDNVLALKDVSLDIKRGEFFVIMGLSGSGKSTLIRCLIRLIEPTSGEILIDGKNIQDFDRGQLMNLRRHTTSMVFQHFGLLPHYTVLENAAYGLRIRGEKQKDRLTKAMEALETVGLKGWEDYYPGALSGGMQQRVGLARALANEPEILLMDEPFSGLDPLIRRQLQDEFLEIQDRLKKTIVFVTHDLYEALKLGSRIAIMKDGQVVQLGTPEEIFSSPADDYVREFVQDASPAKVLTAGTIMEDPAILLYEWQGPRAARLTVKGSRQDFSFVLDKHHRLVGLVTRDSLVAAIEAGRTSLKDAFVSEVPTCGPDTLVEELFPLATASRFPIPVLDDTRRLLGVIRNTTILDSMIVETPEAEADPDA